MNQRIGLADLRRQHRLLAVELEAAVRTVFESSAFVMGEQVRGFEAEAAAYLGAAHAVGVSSGTDALLVALTALGVGPGDEVVTTPFTFAAPAECIVRLGARPRFVDIDPLSLCMSAERLEEAFTSRTRAVLPVHLYGSAPGVDILARRCAELQVPMVEDGAQAFGTDACGRRAGCWGALGCFSFFPAKVLGAAGDAGLIVTADAALAERCRLLRQHGRGPDGVHSCIGGNHRLDAVQAAVLRVKLRHVSRYIATRRRIALEYDAAFAGIPQVTPVPRSAGWNGAVYAIRVLDGRREALRQALNARGIDTAVYYPSPLHLEPAFAMLGHARGAFPHSERAAEELLALPVHSELEDGDVTRVVTAIQEFFSGGRS